MGIVPVFVRIFILGILMFCIPAIVGNCFGQMEDSKSKSAGGALILPWIGGQMLLWGGFQLICVPLIILEKDFTYVIACYGIYMGLLTCYGITRLIRQGKNKKKLRVVRGGSPKGKKELVRWIPLILFLGLLLFQMAQAVWMNYSDGDDAYYVAVSTITENANTMYRKLPYTGGSTGVDVRHGLAPFPVWIAFLAFVSGIKPVSVAHVAVPLMLIPMTYGIFYLIGRRLFPEKRENRLWFLVFTQVLILFGDYSIYTVENFMIARSRQGKAALGSIIIPMLFLLFLVLLEKMQEGKKCGGRFWLLFLCVVMAGCLCSTMGAFLICLLAAVVGICGVICFGQRGTLIPLALSCLPCVCYALIYLISQ